jgi:uncharacterized protein (DUF1810 family)
MENHYPPLDKFLKAQESTFSRALSEIQAGKKTSHWIWFIFPQLAGLGSSDNSKFYSISNLEEARFYLQHSVLGNRLVSISDELLKLPSTSAHEIFGSPDDMKVKSCMTLFSQVPGSAPVFNQVLDKFFKGEKDEKTLKLLQTAAS